ncbi:MAG: hypothetical protein U0793_26070, partial [Gemmataceae bacterium]
PVAGISYFPGIRGLIEAAGNRVLVPRLTSTAGVPHRAAELKDFIDRHSPNEPVHLVAHSMGGLDARYMISCLGMEQRVLSLTTMGTPHRGTAFADWGIYWLEGFVGPILELLGMKKEGFYDVTTTNCRLFNERVPDRPGVRYFSVAGEHNGSFLAPEWLLPYHIVKKAEGPNDGVVSIESSRWGEHLDVWEGDHLSLVNWLHPFARHRTFFRDPEPRFQRILGRLADLGF